MGGGYRLWVEVVDLGGGYRLWVEVIYDKVEVIDFGWRL